MSQSSARNEQQLLIGGKWVEASAASYDIINPATEEVVGQAPNASGADAEAAAAAAREALPEWSAMATEERSALMLKAAESHPGQVRRPFGSGDRRDRGHRSCRLAHAGTSGRRPLRPLRTRPAPGPSDPAPAPGRRGHTVGTGGIVGGMVNRQPVGVVACVTSYNFPMVNMAGKVAPALAAGNTVVVKPAPQDPLAIVELVRILDEVGFPPGVVNLVNASGPEPAATLVDSTDVDMVSFTGSTQIGTRIMEAAGKTMKRLLLELGGKGACVVFDDADIKGAIGCIDRPGPSTQVKSAPRRHELLSTGASSSRFATAWSRCPGS